MTLPITNAMMATFLELLGKRLDSGVLTTEDSIRYTFFAALLRHGIQPEQVVLEHRHKTVSRARIDTAVFDNSGKPAAAVEFKYDRANPGGSSQPLPQKAGAAFADLRRLALLPDFPERYFIYVMDRELARYLASPRNGLYQVFGLAACASITLAEDYFSDRPMTFRKRLGEWPGEVVLECVGAQDLPREHCVRIYAIDREAGLKPNSEFVP
ncbi:hypothetical protein [Mycobacterium sp.]|uniref:hypothetical protein n=1 Tax=Mycobacterium sp. TaxID=1785 RepID=UPI0031D765AF